MKTTQTIDATGHTGGEWFVDMDIIDTATDIRARHGWNGNERAINTLIAQMAGTRNPLRDVNGKLVSVANHAPHLCADPACPGNLNRQKLEMWSEMREALYALKSVAGHCQYLRPGEPYHHLVRDASSILARADKIGKGGQ